MRKFRRLVVDRLYQRGQLELAHVAAADEIAAVWEAIGRGLYAKTTLRSRSSSGKAAPKHPLDRMTQREYDAWRLHYRPWSSLVAKLPGIGGQSLLQTTLRVVLGNEGPRQIERAAGAAHGALVPALVSGLGEYVRIADL